MNFIVLIKNIFSLYNLCRAAIFILTFLSYAFSHANRKSFSNVKPTLKEVWTPQFYNESVPKMYPKELWRKNKVFVNKDLADDYLGALDAVFMGFYALGLYISGYLGDRFSPRIVLGTGMCLSSVVIVLFGSVTEWCHFYNIYLYGFLYALNGLLQSTGWPAAVAIMGNWFGTGRGFWLGGIWSSCASVGNIFGDLITGMFLQYGYDFGFLVPAAMLASGGGVILAGIIVHPNELGRRKLARNVEGYSTIQQHDDDDDDDNDNDGAGDNEEAAAEEEEEDVELIPPSPDKEAHHNLSFCRIILIPGVIPYALAYACLKLVNYAFFFWMSMYMTHEFGWSNEFADKISIWYDVGGIIGGLIAGFLSDFLWSRTPVNLVSLILAIPALVLYRSAPHNPPSTNAIYLAVVGFFITGPANLISSAISADLGTRPMLLGNSGAMSTVTGIIDGTGSVGAAIGQLAVPLIAHRFSWDGVFTFFMIMIAFTILCIIPALIGDIYRLIQRRRNMTESQQ